MTNLKKIGLTALAGTLAATRICTMQVQCERKWYMLLWNTKQQTS